MLPHLHAVTEALVQGIDDVLSRAFSPDPETTAFVAKLQAQRSAMAPADFKSAMRAVRQIEAGRKLLLRRQVAEEIVAAVGPVIALKAVLPKKLRLRRPRNVLAGPTPQAAERVERAGDAAEERERDLLRRVEP